MGLVGDFASILVWFLSGQGTSALLAPYVITKTPVLPPSNSAWVGEEPHRFLGGQVILFCGSHGVFSPVTGAAADGGRWLPPEYNAVFKGELTLNPPLLRRSRTFRIDDPIVMAEQVTTKGADANGKPFSTELLRIDFEGSDFPDNIRIRESHDRRSTGWTTITPLADGRYRIEAHYDVWLEVSVDGGHSWANADNVVTMRLQPVGNSNSLRARRKLD